MTGLPKITGQSRVNVGRHTQFKITDSTNHILRTMDNETKKMFAFNMEDYDMFEVCFESKRAGQIADLLMTLDIKHGVEMKNHEEMSKSRNSNHWTWNHDV